MDKFDELLEELHEESIHQKSGDWLEDLSEDMWTKHFKDNHEVIKEGLNVDTHRWYEITTTVVKVHGRLLGVTLVSNTFSESQGIDDCDHILEFEEMEEYTTVSYRSK